MVKKKYDQFGKLITFQKEKKEQHWTIELKKRRYRYVTIWNIIRRRRLLRRAFFIFYFIAVDHILPSCVLILEMGFFDVVRFLFTALTYKLISLRLEQTPNTHAHT